MLEKSESEKAWRGGWGGEWNKKGEMTRIITHVPTYSCHETITLTEDGQRDGWNEDTEFGSKKNQSQIIQELFKHPYGRPFLIRSSPQKRR